MGAHGDGATGGAPAGGSGAAADRVELARGVGHVERVHTIALFEADEETAERFAGEVRSWASVAGAELGSADDGVYHDIASGAMVTVRGGRVHGLIGTPGR